MLMAKEWLKTWICLSLLFACTRAARPRFDVSTDMGMVLVPADAEVESAIFRLRATDQDADFPLLFEIIATTSPIVRVENLPCTLYNKVCQANVILTRRLVPGRLHDFVVRVRDSKGDVNSMQATISVTNATTQRDKIFPHIPALIMVPEDTKPEKELDYLLVESNLWSGKPVYIELWQPKELFKIRQRQMGSQTKGIITLIGELDFETQSMYTLTMYATDPYTEPGKDTRNIAGLHVVVVVQDVQDVPPVFTLAPPLTKINNTVKPGDVILRVHAEDGDKGVPRDVTYGLISEGNPFTPFFNVSETTGEIILARPLEELTKITHVGAPIVLKIVAEEIRTMRDEPPAQATVVELGLLLGEPGNSPPYFKNDNYVAWMDENAEPGTIIMFTDAYSTLVKDEDIGKAGVFALKLENNNGTFEISPAVAERSANFVITVRDNALIDYEKFKSLRFKITAQEVGPATNLSTSIPVTIFLRDINDNPPVFDVPTYEVTLSENPSPGTRVVQVHATDNDAGIFGRIQYVKVVGMGSEAFEINPDTGLITVSMGTVLDREQTSKLELTVEARDEDGRGLRGVATLIVNILDVNDNAPVFEKGIYEFLLNFELTNFTAPAFIKAIDADAEPPNNVVRYEIIHGNYENKFQLNEETGELMVREALSKSRKIRQNKAGNVTQNMRIKFRGFNAATLRNEINATLEPNSTLESNSSISGFNDFHLLNNLTDFDLDSKNQSRRRRAEDSPLFILTTRAYDLGVPHLANVAQIRIMRPMSMFARIVMFVMPGENPDPKKTAETLATITGSRVTIQEIKPYVPQVNIDSGSDLGKRSVVVARVEQNGLGTLVDVDKIRASLAENGFGIISGMDGIVSDTGTTPGLDSNPSVSNSGKTSIKNVTFLNSNNEEVTVYRTENKLLTWLLVLLGLLLLAAIISLILCCICPSCPFYMEPRKRRIHSSETLVIHSDCRPKRHVHRKPIKVTDGYSAGRKEAWSADPTRQHWQFNRRNTTTKNLGIASLPGDIIPGHRNPEMERLRRAASLRLHNGNAGEPFGEHVMHQTRVIPMPPEDERIYMEDVEALNRNYQQAEMDSLRRHEVERGSDRGQRAEPMPEVGAGSIREQHFYRDGNAEVLRLVTRGEIEDHKDYDQTKDLYHANGKDILLHRFIEDQKLRRSQDLRDSYHGSIHEADVDRSMESHHRVNEMPAEILIIPERLEMQCQPSYGQRQHQQDVMLKPDIQRLVVEGKGMLRVPIRDVEVAAGESSRNMRSSAENVTGRDRNAPYSTHDTELVRQNALLTRLLLEKEARSLNVPVADNSSFLETQSLPGQVAIATQTDRTTATQTEYFFKSRSDNEECDEDPRIRRKSKLKGRVETQEDFKKMKTIWVRTPIPEESRAQSGSKKATPTRTKIEVAESRNASISPDVLKELSNSQKSDDSEDNEEDEEDKLSGDQAEISSSKMQKMQKVISKSISSSKKKIKEERIENDSSTTSPDTKEKDALMKGKNRKKVEKPPRAKKLEKSIESEKSNFMEPSFRVLEREISSFQQKIRQFGDKKLKKLKKDDKDVNKKDKVSEDDTGTCNISKKCEVTVKKHTKTTVSRESSPIKISVEQKTIASEEETSARERSVKRHQENISSSDLDDDNPKRGSSTFSERTTQCETSKTQTRSRSLLRRQANMDNSDTKSSSEKLDKSEDNDTKTDKSKESTSSLDIKVDTISSSSRDFSKHQKQMENVKTKKIPVPDKRNIPDEKVTVKTKPAQIINIKRKISSLRSKIVDEPPKKDVKKDGSDKIKSLTSDESKSTSPMKSKENLFMKKSITSEDEKSSKEIKSKSSASKESAMALEFDKFVKDVKGAVEKEISSITQAAKEALNIKKSSISDSEKKDEKSKVSKKLKEFKDSQKLIDKNQKQISGTSKQKLVTSKVINKEKTSKSLKEKDKKDKLKDQKKIKSVESDSSANVKSDDAISFIVFENSKSIKSSKEIKTTEDLVTSESSKHTINEKSKDLSKKLDKSNEFMKIGRKTSNNILDTMKDVENTVDESKSAQEFDNAKTVISDSILDINKDVKEIIDKTGKVVKDEIDLTKQNISEKIDNTKKAISDKFGETEKKVSKQIDETKKAVSEDIQKTKETVSNRIDETKKTVSDEIEDTQKNVSERIIETERAVLQEIDETNQIVTAAIDKTKQSTSEIIDNTKVFTDKTIDQSKESVSATIGESKKVVSIIIDETKETMPQKIDKPKNVITDKFNKTKQTTSDTLHTSKVDVNDTVNKIQESASDALTRTTSFIDDKVDEAKTISIDNIPNGNNTIADKIDETNQDLSKLVNSTAKSIDDKLVEAKQSITDTVSDTKKTVGDAVDKTQNTISDAVGRTSTFIGDKARKAETMLTDTVHDTKKGVGDAVDKTQETVSDSIGKTTKFVRDKVEKAETIVTDTVHDTKEAIGDTVDKTQKTVSDAVDGTSEFIGNKVGKTEATAIDAINDVKKAVRDTVDKTNQDVSKVVDSTVTNIVDKTEEGTFSIVDSTKKFIGDKVEKVKSSVSEFVDETKEIAPDATDISKKVDKADKTVADTVHDAKETTTNIVEKTEEGLSNILDDTKKFIGDKVEKVKSSVSEFIDETKEISPDVADVSKKVDGVEKTTMDTIHDIKETAANIVDKTEEGVSNIVDDTKKFIDDKVEEVKSSVSEFIDETKEISPDATDVSKKVDEVKETTTDAISDTKENVTNIVAQTEHVSNIVDGATKFIGDKVEKVKSSISEFIDETKEISPAASTKTQNVLDNVNNLKQSATVLIDETEKSVSDKIDNSVKSIQKSGKDSVTKTYGIATTQRYEKEKNKTTHKKSTDSENKATVSSASLPKDSKEHDQPELKIESDSLVTEITKEMLEAEKIYASGMQEEFTKQQGLISSGQSSNAQDNILEMPEVKQTRKNELPREDLLRQDSTTSKGLGKGKKALLTGTTQLTEMKEKKIHEKQQTDSKRLSRSSSSDKKSFKEFSSKGQTNADKLASTSASSKKKLASTSVDTTGKSISSAEEDEKSSIKVSPPSQPEKPILQVTDATTGEEEGEASEDDSSSASDISSKTALHTRPYSTPRHSISSEGEGDSVESSVLGKSTGTAKTEGKPRQRWSPEKGRDSRSKVETPQTGEYAKAIFPQKIEVTPMDKPKISAGKTPIDQPTAPKPLYKNCQETSKSTAHAETHVSEKTENKHTETTKTRSVIASVRKKDHSRTDRFSRFAEARKSSPRREKAEVKSEDKKNQSSTSEQRKVEIRSRHLKLHVSHHYREAKDVNVSPSAESTSRDEKRAATRIASPAKEREGEETHGTGTARIIDHGKDPEIANARSRYMVWYQQKRAEMERKRREKKEAEEEQQKPKWLRRATAKSRKAKSAEEPKEDRRPDDKGTRSRERAKSSTDAVQTTPHGSRKRVKPLVNVESEQLKAIVRQGRKLRKAEGGREEDLPVQIFVPEKPPAADSLESAMQLEPRHHLTQHSEYKYEKTVPTMPFYLHPPPPVPHSSPEHFQEDSSDSRRMDDDMDSGIAVSMQGGARLRHQQLLEKKSVFDIAYNEAAPGQLRSDSSTPPS